jgi:hypothetical protein
MVGFVLHCGVLDDGTGRLGLALANGTEMA